MSDQKPSSTRVPATSPRSPDPTGGRLIICDDHPMVTDGMVLMLEPPYSVVAVVQTGADLFKCLATTPADCLLLDLSLPDRAGATLLPEVREAWPDLKIIVVTMHTEKVIADECLRLGAAGFVPKVCGATELIEAVAAVLAGQRVPLRPLRRTHGVGLAAAHPGWERLTPRQHEILLRLGQGSSQKEIAGVLHSAPQTIGFHVERIKKVLGFATTAELLRHAVLLSVSDPPPPDETKRKRRRQLARGGTGATPVSAGSGGGGTNHGRGRRHDAEHRFARIGQHRVEVREAADGFRNPVRRGGAPIR